jgi:superoxide dismutase, Cu-Zn family
MKKRGVTIGIVLVLIAVVFIAYSSAMQQSADWSEVSKAVAVLHPTEGNSVKGLVMLIETNGVMTIHVDLEGLKPNSTHGFHIHQWGDGRAADATSAGDHYAPQGHRHGAPDDEEHHAGDLGNLQADAEGRVQHKMTVDFISIAGTKNPVLGRAVIIHAEADDFESQPTGAAGARLACGVIGIANPNFKDDTD